MVLPIQECTINEKFLPPLSSKTGRQLAGCQCSWPGQTVCVHQSRARELMPAHHHCYHLSLLSPITQQLTPQSTVPAEKLTVVQLVIFCYCMETKCSSQRPATCDPSQINPVHILPAYICKFLFNFVLPSMPSSSRFSLDVKFPSNTLCACLFYHSCRMPCPPHLPSFDPLIIFVE